MLFRSPNISFKYELSNLWLPYVEAVVISFSSLTVTASIEVHIDIYSQFKHELSVDGVHNPISAAIFNSFCVGICCALFVLCSQFAHPHERVQNSKFNSHAILRELLFKLDYTHIPSMAAGAMPRIRHMARAMRRVGSARPEM